MTKIKRLNVSLVDESEVSMFKSFCKIQGIALPEDYDERFNIPDDEFFPVDAPYVVFNDLGEVVLADEPDEDFVWLNGLEGFMYIYEKFQDQEAIVEELKNAGTFENLYIKLLEGADEDFDFDEPESWDTEEDEDGECECECPECKLEELVEEVRSISRTEVKAPFKLIFLDPHQLRLAVEGLEAMGLEAKETVRDTDLFLAVYDDKTFETFESSRVYLGLDIPEGVNYEMFPVISLFNIKG
jgi:hypothetical protein|nr:MAG TPA: hypothetical protein [Caudoviricetes sp.]